MMDSGLEIDGSSVEYRCDDARGTDVDDDAKFRAVGLGMWKEETISGNASEWAKRSQTARFTMVGMG